MKPNRITMVGGGLVGAICAVMLSRRGYFVDVFEKRPDMRVASISAGRSINLALAERGITALKLAGLMDQIEPLLIPMKGRMLHEVNGSLEFSPYGQRPHEVIYSVSRGELNKVMLSAAESSQRVRIEFDHECTQVDLVARRICLRDTVRDREFDCDFEMLIGTDGAGSSVRDAVVESAHGDWTMSWLDHDYKELTIPAGPNSQHQLEKNALHIWPRHGFMLIALPNLDGSFTVTLFLNKIGIPSFEQLTGPAEVQDFFRAQFPDAASLLPDLHSEFFENPTGNLGTVQCSKWVSPDNGAVLLGDAAHAVVPFHGQGMNAGFEDCRELVRLLDRHNDDWAKALSELEQIRIPNANAIAEMALENYVTMRDSVLDPRFQLKKLVGFELERRLPDRFIPRYSMVMFTNIPYALAQQRGEHQENILDQVISGCTSVNDVDFAAAERMVRGQLDPLAPDLLA